MSAYIVEKDTINEIVGACVTYGLASVEIGDVVGQILWDANRAAVAYRYGEKVTEAEYSYYPTPATIGQRARSLSNLIYQCVDHPAWTSFEAREICVRLSVAMLQEIPGYADGVTR